MKKIYLMMLLTVAVNFNAQAQDQDTELRDRVEIIDIMSSYHGVMMPVVRRPIARGAQSGAADSGNGPVVMLNRRLVFADQKALVGTCV